MASLVFLIGKIINKIEIPYTAKIGGGLLIGHTDSIVFHENCIIGENVTIVHSVTIGGNIGKSKNDRISPIIEDNVLVGAGARILGPITVGKNSMVGANAVLTKDLPDNSVAVGIPAKVIKKVEKPFIKIEENLSNGNYL